MPPRIKHRTQQSRSHGLGCGQVEGSRAHRYLARPSESETRHCNPRRYISVGNRRGICFIELVNKDDGCSTWRSVGMMAEGLPPNFHCHTLHAQGHPQCPSFRQHRRLSQSQQLRPSLQRRPCYDCSDVGGCRPREGRHPASVWRHRARPDATSPGA